MTLTSVDRVDEHVELRYGIDDSGALEELQGLVEAEQGCCGAAGVDFELLREPDGLCLVVSSVRDGLPARTVLAAFAVMAPSVSKRKR